MFNDITIEEALKKENAVFVDVRSPDEYETDALPSSINVPILDNEQRALVGKTYQEKGPKEARLLAVKLVSPFLPQKIDQINRLKANKNLVVYCWRGGMRSKAMCQLLDLAGIHSTRLLGGYKSYRKLVNQFFDNLPSFRFIVLYGLTGVGKTEILEELQAKGFPVLNLERLAMHRGSVFGGVGLNDQPSQKKFESSIFNQLRFYPHDQVIFVEGESRKIGKLFIPEKLFLSMKKGKRVLVYDLISNRVNRIIKEYTNGFNNNLQELENAIKNLQRQIGKAKVEKLIDYLQLRKFAEVIEELLISHYDILYHHPDRPSQEYDYCVSAENTDRAVLQLIDYYKHLSQSKGG